MIGARTHLLPALYFGSGLANVFQSLVISLLPERSIDHYSVPCTRARTRATRLTIALSPELHRRLQDYAVAYANSYCVDEPVTELVPAMLAGFLDGYRHFSRSKK
jgi:hypothetical protein